MSVTVQSGAASTGLAAAAQSDQETATSTTLAVTPGRQQFHPSAAKCWAYVTVATGTPTLAASYNITSITDTGVGDLTITIATDFSSANWCALASLTLTNSTTAETVEIFSQAAGSVELKSILNAVGVTDPVAWHFAGLGDQ